MERISGSKLIFISRIKRDGSGVITEFTPSFKDWIKHENFTLRRLSISENTYIASGMSSYVVKLKELK